MMPTGAADPYALRRNALGVCRIILELGLTLDISVLLREAQAGYAGVEWKLQPEEALEKLMDFFGQRLRAFWNAQGVETLVLEAAMAPGFADIFETWRRVKALADFSREADFEASVLTFKRAANIIRRPVRSFRARFTRTCSRTMRRRASGRLSGRSSPNGRAWPRPVTIPACSRCSGPCVRWWTGSSTGSWSCATTQPCAPTG
jgi:glycyl-tRNA synthetase beta subunit